MACFRPIQQRFVQHLRTDGFQALRQRSFGIQEIDLRQHLLGIQNEMGIGSQLIGHGLQYANPFAPLRTLQFADVIVGIHHLLRLYIDRFAGSRFVVHDTADLAFVARRDRDYQSSLADRRSRVGFHEPVRFGLPQDGLQGTSHGSLQVGNLAPDTCQFGRSAVRQPTIAVQDAVDRLHQRSQDSLLFGSA